MSAVQPSDTVHRRISRETSPAGLRTRFKCDRQAGRGKRLLAMEMMLEACCGHDLIARKSMQHKPTSRSSVEKSRKQAFGCLQAAASMRVDTWRVQWRNVPNRYTRAPHHYLGWCSSETEI